MTMMTMPGIEQRKLATIKTNCRSTRASHEIESDAMPSSLCRLFLYLTYVQISLVDRMYLYERANWRANLLVCCVVPIFLRFYVRSYPNYKSCCFHFVHFGFVPSVRIIIMKKRIIFDLKHGNTFGWKQTTTVKYDKRQFEYLKCKIDHSYSDDSSESYAYMWQRTPKWNGRRTKQKQTSSYSVARWLVCLYKRIVPNHLNIFHNMCHAHAFNSQ